MNATQVLSRTATAESERPSEKATPAKKKSRTSWRYDPAGKRDLRVDLARGLAIVVMATNHLGGASYLNSVTQGRIYASAAEAFVFLSGFVLGMISLGRLVKDGFRDANGKLLGRALTLYKTYLVMAAVAAVATFVKAGSASPVFDDLHFPIWKVALAGPLLHLSPRLIDVLQLYVLLLGASPAVLYALHRKWTLPLLVASVSLWGIHQLHPYALSTSPLGREHAYFALPAWQLLYVGGFVFGYHKETIAKAWSKVPRWLVVGITLPILGAAVVANHYDTRLGMWPEGVSERAQWIALADRSSLGAVRVVTVAALFTFLWTCIDGFYKPLERTIGKPLVTLGQNSLYVYVVHVPIVVLWHALKLPTMNVWITTFAQLGVLVALWTMIKTKFLFRIVPR